MAKKTYNCLLLADVDSDVLLIKSELSIKEIHIQWEPQVPDVWDKYYFWDHFDVILVDLNIWGRRSIKEFKRLYAKAAGVPIIIINEEKTEKAAMGLIDLGAWDYFTRSTMDKKMLLHSIRHALISKSTGEALHRSEMRFKTLSQFAFNWEYWQDPDGSMRYVSPSCKEVTGYSVDEFMKQPSLYKMIVFLEDRKIFSEHHKKRMQAKGLQKIQFRIRKKDGTVCWVEHRCQDIVDTQGKYLGVRVSCRDLTELKKADNELRSSEKRFQSLIQSAQDTIMITEVDTGIILDANQRAEELTGLPIHKIIGLHHAELYPPERKDRYMGLFKKRVKENRPTQDQMYILRSNGQEVPVEITSSVVEMQGKLIILDIYRDISERKRAEQQLRKLSTAVEQSPASVIITGPNGIIEYVNDRFLESTGYRRDEVYGENVNLLKSGKTNKEQYVSLWSTIREGKKWRGEFLNKKKNGDLFWEYTSISPIINDEGTITHYLAVKQDLTDKKEEEKRLMHQANYDSLTNLPNRTLAFDRINQAIYRAKREHMCVGVMFIDLDRFKIVNDTLGHDMGDKLLIEAADRLQECVRESDTVARFGGDEFLIVMPSLESLSNSAILARRTLQAFMAPFIIDQRQIFIGLSIGITGYPMDGNNAQILLRNSDTAMYQAKEAEGNTYRFYTHEMNTKAVERMNIESHLRYALEKNELIIYYQPIMDIDERLIGLEVLLRWSNPEIGNVPPNYFIPLAEETGMIIPIGNWIIEQAVKQVKQWNDDSGMDLRLAINVSSRQFRETDLVKTVSDVLKANDFPANLLELEITERLLMEDAPRTSAMLNALSQQGVRLSIDDFGTGYSSLSYLKKFPFNTLKIDRAFINDVLDEAENATLTKTIISMAHSLSLDVVAEGVEEVEQLYFLKENHCDLVQGYYFSKPVPANLFYEYIGKNMKDKDA
jgi:diguanylate cyclase (GGDEF)-like protein/PAS domain S-box-containing protein